MTDIAGTGTITSDYGITPPAAPSIVSESAIFWLDAADESTIVKDASDNVTTWTSKAGDQRVATVRDSSKKPVYRRFAYGRPCVDFGGFNSGVDMSYTEFSNVMTAFFVLADLLERGRSPLPGGEFNIAPFAFATIRIEREGLNVVFASASEKWTGLLVRPRAFAGGIPGQMYLLWGAEEGIDAYELYRDGKMVATVHREAEDGIPFMNVRYDDRGLEPGRRYEYRIRPVFRNGQRGELGTPFYGLTRATISGLGMWSWKANILLY